MADRGAECAPDAIRPAGGCGNRPPLTGGPAVRAGNQTNPREDERDGGTTNDAAVRFALKDSPMSWFNRSRETSEGPKGPAAARSFVLGGIEVVGPWARASLPATAEGGGFFMITNKGTTPDRLIAASSPVAERVEIHAITVVGDGLRMREREHGLALFPGTTLTLKPRGYHLLLTGLKAPLEPGSQAPVTLAFESAGKMDIELAIMAPGAVGTQTL
ncbi:MAG: copper chaperone PCu(A)C [Alphaproteobacteria bacterium]|nr:copper chaperone PCu(A)C [Alphaproteobacteria bacterium]